MREDLLFAYAKPRTQISCTVTVQRICTFVFATYIVDSLCFLNPKFQASSHPLWLYSQVCVGLGQKLWRGKVKQLFTLKCFVQKLLYFITLSVQSAIAVTSVVCFHVPVPITLSFMYRFFQKNN